MIRECRYETPLLELGSANEDTKVMSIETTALWIMNEWGVGGGLGSEIWSSHGIHTFCRRLVHSSQRFDSPRYAGHGKGVNIDLLSGR